MTIDRTWLEKWTKVPARDETGKYQAFKKWAQAVYGWWEVSSNPRFMQENYQDSSYYLEWEKAGYPGWGTVMGDVAPKGEVAPPVTETTITEPTEEELEPGYWKNPQTGEVLYIGTDEERARAWRIEAQLEQPSYQQQLAQEARLWQYQRAATEKEQWEREFTLRQQQQEEYDVRAKQVEEFEVWRGRLLGQLSGPANEVARWFVEHRPNPYVLTRAEMVQRAQPTEPAPQTWQPADIGGEIPTPAPQDIIGTVTKALAQLQGVPGTEGEAQPAWQMGPPTPSWVREYAPQAGKRIGLEKGLGGVPAPSGQQLTRMTPSQSEWLGGTMGFLGKSWQDLLSKAALMQPYSPSGAGRTTWRPPSQKRV